MKKRKKHNEYETLLTFLKSKVISDKGHYLFDQIRKLSNGLVHADFVKVYRKTKETYESNEFNSEFLHPTFTPNSVISTTITKYGLCLDMETGTAVDSLGNPIPAEKHEPKKSSTIPTNFKAYYMTSVFLFTFEILFLGFKESVFLRDSLSVLPPQTAEKSSA